MKFIIPFNRIRSRLTLSFSIALLTGLSIVGISSSNSHGQIFEQKKEVRVDNDLVPENVIAAFSFQPQTLIENPKLSSIPREVITAAGVREFGFDPMLIEDATFLVAECKEGGIDSPPRWAFVMRFSELQGLSGAMIEQFEETTIKGKKAYFQESYPNKIGFLIYDESTIFFGDSTLIEDMLTKGQGGVAKLMENKKVNGDLMGFIDIQSTRPLFDELFKDVPKLSQPAEDLKQLPKFIRSMSFGTSVGKRLETEIIMVANNPEDAEVAKEIITNGLEFFQAFLITELGKEMDMRDPVQAATIQYVNRIWNKYEEKMIPEVNGSSMKITLHEEIMALPFLVGFTSSSVAQALDPPFKPQNQARQIALGILNYESAYRKLPAHTIRDENGKPLFSGRVAFLPFVEQNALYQSLKMDEPWDSKHNSEFTKMQVMVFEDVGGTGMMRFPVFPGSMWDQEEGLQFRDILDGTSNTILAIQAPPEKTVSWADPTPWKISPTNPMRDVFGDRDEVWVVMLDGSTQRLKKSEMTNEKLKAMLTYAGGEVIR
ncbi:MAG: DUF1559 domain-containing protein [Planctomycetota bacterium]